jgi:hypothetical protein
MHQSTLVDNPVEYIHYNLYEKDMINSVTVMAGRGLPRENELLLGAKLLDCVPLQLNKFIAENE